MILSRSYFKLYSSCSFPLHSGLGRRSGTGLQRCQYNVTGGCIMVVCIATDKARFSSEKC